jgi:RES domain-containing protein
MRLFRVTTQRDPRAAFDGMGASLYPGRWNERGRRAVYATARLPLGMLEVLVQSPLSGFAGFVAYPLDVPDDTVTRFDRTRLSPAWRTMAGRDECRGFGEQWRASNASAGLAVPSAVLPEAYDFGDVNVVLDPLHPDFTRVEVGKPIALDVDVRLRALLSPP